MSLNPPVPSTAPAPPPGLINATAPPVSPTSSAAPTYTPATAAATPATAVGSTPNAFTVTPDQTVSGQIKNIIASGSPLMAQAESNAKNQMNQRGLINSSIGIGAGQSALYAAATPIATADAATAANAATNTTNAQNTAKAAQAAAQNTASGTNAQLGTAVSQTNAGATNTMQSTAQQIQGSTNLADIQAATSSAIAKLQSDTTLTSQDKSNATQQLIAGLQANTSLSLQDKASAAQAIMTAANNASAQQIAAIQASTTLSVEDKQTQSAQVIAGMNNDNAKAVQQMVNDGNLATIAANGAINVQITNLTNANKLLLQTSSGAASLYSTTLQNMSAIMGNKDLTEDQKTTALNNSVAALKDGLTAISSIANNTAVNSTLNFGGGGTPPAPGATPGQQPVLTSPDGRPVYEVNGGLIYSDGSSYSAGD